MTDKTDALTLARDAYRDSTTYFDTGIRHEIERDLRQFMGLHPSNSKYLSELYRTRSRFFRPKTRSVIRKNEAVAAAALFSNADVITIDPEDHDDATQVAGSKILHQLVNIRLKRHIPWFQLCIGAYQDAQAVGICILHPHWDKKKDRPSIELVPIENFRFSPASSWVDPVGTSPYLIRLIPMYVKDVKARVKLKADGTEGKWKAVDETKIMTAAQRYSDSIKLQRETGRADSQANASTINDFSIVWVHQNIIEIDGEDQCFYTLSDQELLSDPKPLSQSYLHGMRPFVVGSAVIETHKLYPSGVGRLTRDTQGEINELANLRMDTVRFALGKRYFVKRGSQTDVRSLSRNVPGSSTMMNDPEKDVKVIETNDVVSSAYEEHDRLNADFDELAGSFSASSISGNRKLGETEGGLELLSADSNELQNYQLRTFAETAVKPTLRHLVELEKYYETDEALLALAGRKANLVKEHSIDEIDAALMLTPVEVNVHVGVGATTPTMRLNHFLAAMRALKEILSDGVLGSLGLDIEEVTSEIFGKLGYDSGKRFFDWEDENPQVKFLKAQLAELQASVSAKDPPEIIAAKVQLLEAQAKQVLEQVEETKAKKVKTGVEATFGAMQAAEVVATVPMVAPVADQIMRAAGYQEPVPVGMDPGFAPGEQLPGQVETPVSAAAAVAPPGMPADGLDREPGVDDPSSNPLTPAPASSGMGFNGGIETMRSDSEGADQ